MSKSRTATLSANINFSDGQKIPTIHFTPAYDGGVCSLDPSSWPYPVVFDLNGFDGRQTVPIVRDHDQDQKVGQTDSILYGPQDLTATGKMLNIGIDESADKILALWKRGSALQASIHTDLIDPSDIDFIEEGESVEVNHQTFPGPIEVVRKTSLREISIVTVGANAGTSVTIAASLPKSSTPNKEINTMSVKKTQRTAKAEAPVEDIVSAVIENAVEEVIDAVNEPADPIEEAVAELEEGFVAWLTAKGFDPATLSEDALTALKIVYDAEAADAEAADEEEKDKEAGCADEDPIPPDEKKEGAASYRRKSPRSRSGVAASYRSYAGPANDGPNSAKVAVASLLIGSGINPGKLSREKLGENGFSDDELHEADTAKNRALTPTGLLFKAGMCSGSNFRDLGHISRVMDTAKHVAASAGIQPGRYSRKATAAGGIGNADVPNIFADVMHKSMLVGFRDVPGPTDAMSKVVKAQDLRTQNFWTLNANGGFSEVADDGELNVLKLNDANYTNTATLRGAEVRYSYKLLLNDDQNALVEIPNNLGRRFKIAKQKIWWKTLCAGISSNLTANPVLGVSGLDKAWAKLAAVTDAAGDPWLVTPKFVIVPTALGGTVKQIHASLNLVAAGGNTLSIIPNSNVYNSAFEPIITPFVGGGTDNSATWGDAGWLVIADPADLPAMILSYLNGNDFPTVETKNGDFAVDGIRIATWWGFGASFAEGKACAFSTGAGS